MKNKQTDYKSDGEYGYDKDPIAPAMPGQKKESPFAPVESSKPKKKKKKKDYANLSDEEIEAKAYKKADRKFNKSMDSLKKRAGTGNHPLNK
jgi:hypothetical protein